MKYSTVYVGMDVHKETFSVCCYTNEDEKAEYCQTMDAHYSKVLNYLEAMRLHYGEDALFISDTKPAVSDIRYITSWLNMESNALY